MYEQLLGAARKFRNILLKRIGIRWEYYGTPQLTQDEEAPHLHFLIYGLDCSKYEGAIVRAWRECGLGHIVKIVAVRDEDHHDTLAGYFAKKKYAVDLGKGRCDSLHSHLFYKQTRALMRHEAHYDGLRAVAGALRILLETPGAPRRLTHRQIADVCEMKDIKRRLGGQTGYLGKLETMGYFRRVKDADDARMFIFTLCEDCDYSDDLMEILKG